MEKGDYINKKPSSCTLSRRKGSPLKDGLAVARVRAKACFTDVAHCKPVYYSYICLMKKHFLIPSALCLFTSYLFAQGTWTQKANFGGAGRWGAAGFSIGTKGYIGVGASGNHPSFT